MWSLACWRCGRNATLDRRRRRRAPPRTSSWASWPRRPERRLRAPARAGPSGLLSGPVGTGSFDLDPHQDPALVLHGPAVVVPGGVRAGRAPVVVDQAVHGFGERHDGGSAVDLDPRAVELVAEDAQRGPGVTAKVLHLDRRLPAAEDDGPGVVDAAVDRRHLGPAVASGRRQHGVVMPAHEVARLVDVHGANATCGLRRSVAVLGHAPVSAGPHRLLEVLGGEAHEELGVVLVVHVGVKAAGVQTGPQQLLGDLHPEPAEGGDAIGQLVARSQEVSLWDGAGDEADAGRLL